MVRKEIVVCTKSFYIEEEDGLTRSIVYKGGEWIVSDIDEDNSLANLVSVSNRMDLMEVPLDLLESNFSKLDDYKSLQEYKDFYKELLNKMKLKETTSFQEVLKAIDENYGRAHLVDCTKDFWENEKLSLRDELLSYLDDDLK